MAIIYAFDRRWPRGPRGMVLLREEQIWREKFHPKNLWVVASLIQDQYGRNRVRIEPVNDRNSELTYSESHFRKYFQPMVEVLSNKNWEAQTFTSDAERNWFRHRVGLWVVG